MTGPLEMQYKYDIFLSTKWRPVFTEWIEEHFIPNLKSFLTEDLSAFCDRECEIFYFREALRPGDVWPNKLVEAIRRSRVGLALCSPSYFRSEWCIREFKSFHRRNATASGGGLLVPVSIHDGHSFPTWATSELQFDNLNDYVNTGPGFRETKKYVEFQDKLKRLSALLAERIALAPPFEEWELWEESVEPLPDFVPQVRL